MALGLACEGPDKLQSPMTWMGQAMSGAGWRDRHGCTRGCGPGPHDHVLLRRGTVPHATGPFLPPSVPIRTARGPSPQFLRPPFAAACHWPPADQGMAPWAAGAASLHDVGRRACCLGLWGGGGWSDVPNAPAFIATAFIAHCLRSRAGAVSNPQSCMSVVESLRGKASGGWGGHKASVLGCLPLAAPIGLSPLPILTLCGPERVLVVSTEPLDDVSCLTTAGLAVPETGCCPCR